jgi:hypothetical protein
LCLTRSMMDIVVRCLMAERRASKPTSECCLQGIPNAHSRTIVHTKHDNRLTTARNPLGAARMHASITTHKTAATSLQQECNIACTGHPPINIFLATNKQAHKQASDRAQIDRHRLISSTSNANAARFNSIRPSANVRYFQALETVSATHRQPSELAHIISALASS